MYLKELLNLGLSQNLTVLCLYYTFQKSFEVMINVKVSKFEGAWDKLQANIVVYIQYWTKYLVQKEEIRQKKTGSKTFDICHCIILNSIAIANEIFYIFS